MKGTHKRIRKTIILVFWLGVWQVAAALTDNAILLAGPVQVLHSFVGNLQRPDFFHIVLHSTAGIGLGFFMALFAGMLFGSAGYCMAWVEEALAPVMAALKSVPVASFVVLLLIWFGAGRLTALISFLIVFPNVFVNTIAGLKSTDRKLLEMSHVFGMSRARKLIYIYMPALMPHLGSCLKISLGMSWKSGVAAEIIGLSESSLGEQLYMSKIYLDTAGLFAWTVTIVLVSFLFEKAVLWLFQRIAAWRPYPACGVRAGSPDVPGSEQNGRTGHENRRQESGRDERIQTYSSVRMLHVDKAYNGRTVLQDYNLTMEAGGRYLLMAPSGAGKTTLLKILTGLEKADRGRIEGTPDRIGMVFQEDRLCEECDVVCNILLGMRVGGRRRPLRYGPEGLTGKQLTEYVQEQAAKILPEECLTNPVKNLSGGMRRRVALLRALLSDADLLIFDEPFSGLDEENRARCVRYLMENLQGRMFLMSTHREEDADLLQAAKVRL